MKTTFIYLGILVAIFNNAAATNNFDHQASFHKSEEAKATTVLNTFDDCLKKPIIEDTSVSDFTDSILVLSEKHTPSIEEIITENNKIIESNIEDFLTALNDRDIIEVIKEDNQIIESTITNEVFPLNFEIINVSTSIVKR